MDNLSIYNATRTVAEEAKRPIDGGRLKGKTDINPMWRIKVLTERFGPCGIGWYTDIVKQWVESGAGGEVAAFCNVNLFIMVDGEWSVAIPGTGGSMMVTKESGGLHTDDECFKKANTDAISVACKMLGIGADVYWEKDSTKYDNPLTQTNPKQEPPLAAIACPECGQPVKGLKAGDKLYTAEQVLNSYGCCAKCHNAKKKEHSNDNG